MSVAKTGSDDHELRQHQQRRPAQGDLPPLQRRGSPSSRLPPMTTRAPPNSCRPPTTRSSRSRPLPTATAARAGSAGTAASRGGPTTSTTPLPTSATTAAMSTSSRRASASGRPPAGPAMATRPARRWRLRRSPVRPRCTRPPARSRPQRGPRVAPLSGQLRLGDLHRPGRRPRSTARRRSRGCARVVRRRLEHDPGQGPLERWHVVVPVTVTRSSTFFERIRLSVTGIPSGWTATLTATSLLGWTVERHDRHDQGPSHGQAGHLPAHRRGHELGTHPNRHDQHRGRRRWPHLLAADRRRGDGNQHRPALHRRPHDRRARHLARRHRPVRPDHRVPGPAQRERGSVAHHLDRGDRPHGHLQRARSRRQPSIPGASAGRRRVLECLGRDRDPVLHLLAQRPIDPAGLPRDAGARPRARPRSARSSRPPRRGAPP